MSLDVRKNHRKAYVRNSINNFRSQNFIEYKGSPPKNSNKKNTGLFLLSGELNTDLKDAAGTAKFTGEYENPDTMRVLGNISKQSLALMGSVSSRRERQSVTGDNTTTARKQANLKKVIMHVNQFVPYFM